MIDAPDTPLHSIRPDHLEDLFRGDGGAPAVSEIAAAQYSKTILMIQFVVRRVEALGHPHAAIARAAYGAHTEFRRNHPEAFFSVLQNPAVIAWSSRAARGLCTGPATGEPGLLGAVATAVALRAGATARLELPGHLSNRLILPAAGRVRLPGEPGHTLTADVTAGRVLITRDGQDTAGWTPAVWLGPGQRITLGPLLLTGDPPAADPGAWRNLFDRALTVLTRRHQRVAEEIGVVLRQVCPISAPAGGQTSGTHHDAFGAIATSWPHGPDALALTLAHELQHNKLVAIDHLMPLVRPGCPELYYAPWRTDRRPLIGLLHGVYAHVGVASFWRGELEAGLSGRARRHAEVEFARWSSASADVAAGLRGNPWLTPTGRALVQALHSRIESWKERRISASATAVAQARQARHRARWMRDDST